jgi:mannose-1-phosphate guanylyltransferase
MIYCVILAGGKGERFWPKSRELSPKQLIALTSDRTMLEESISRIGDVAPLDNTMIICTRNLLSSILGAIPNFPIHNIILEPFGRNTAPAIGLASSIVAARDADATMLVLPADHYISDGAHFTAAANYALKIAAERNALVTFGIIPARPETGYGYIEIDSELERSGLHRLYSVKAFHEKPDTERAMEFLKSGDHFWNSGIFAWSVSSIFESYQTHMPQLHAGMVDLRANLGKGDDTDRINEFYRDVDEISIDYGIMEKAKNVVMVRGDFIWDDIGSWSALERTHTPDAQGNVTIGECVSIDTRDSIFLSDDGMIAALGVKDLIVVRSGNVTMVCKKNRAQDIRKIVQLLRERKLVKYL